MKIEKLTKNKIRVVVSFDDLEIENMDINSLFTQKKQSFFVSILEKAKKELDFETDGYKLLVETFSLNNDFVIFTITKYSFKGEKNTLEKKKKNDFSKDTVIYEFEDFDEFCNFCNCISKFSNLNYKLFSRNISLYLYKNTYYLLIKNINISYKNKKIFYSLISEFGKPLSFSNTFENKLIEYGKVIIKKDAIEKGIKYFS